MNSSPRNLLCFTSMLLVIASASLVHAQVSLVTIKVDKKQKLEREKSGDGSTFVQLKETLSYNIEVKNISSIDLSKVTIKWAVLYQPFGYVRLETHGSGWSSSTSSGGGIKQAKGEETCNIGPGRKHEFDTASIELGTLETNAPDRARDYHGKALGYLVEVFVDDKMVGSKAVPSDIKRRIKDE